jgi:hypothetical protein
MQASPKTLVTLMSSAQRFEIPEYQRPYCWTTEEVEQLWNDLFEAYEESKDSTASAVGKDDYFLGPIVVAKRRERTGEISAVVDGQQRLTTIHALLWAAMGSMATSSEADEMRNQLQRLLLTPSGVSSLAVAREDQHNFQALREGTPLDEARDLGLAGSLLRKQLANVPTINDLVGFLNFALNQTTFILVETENYSSAWDLFIGLNGKGRPLNAADLIKAFVCGKSDDGAAAADIWRDKVLPLKNDAASALLEITRIATGNVGSEAKLFKLFEAAWKDNRIKNTLIGDGALTYQSVWHAALDQLPVQGMEKRSLRGLRSIDRRDHSALVLALAARFGRDFVFRPALLRALEAYQFAMAIRGKRGRERDFTLLASSIYSSSTSASQALADVAKLLTSLVPTTTEVNAAVRSAAYPGRIMKLIINQYEEGMRGDVQVDDVQYEHMMPKTPTAFWHTAAGTTDANTYARLVNNIGNIAPLDYKTNIAGQNDDWPTKRALYMKHVPNWLVSNLAKSNPIEWTPTQIDKRASDVADWAVTERWNFGEAIKGLL